jgi:hypothetical protein
MIIGPLPIIKTDLMEVSLGILNRFLQSLLVKTFGCIQIADKGKG